MQLVGSDALCGDVWKGWGVVVGGVDGYWQGALHKVANDFWPFGHKQSFTTAELLLFQLFNKFYLVFAYHIINAYGAKLRKNRE